MINLRARKVWQVFRRRRIVDMKFDEILYSESNGWERLYWSDIFFWQNGRSKERFKNARDSPRHSQEYQYHFILFHNLFSLVIKIVTKNISHFAMVKCAEEHLNLSQVKTYGPVPTVKHRKSAEHRSSILDRMSQNFSSDFRSGILLLCSVDFQCFHAGLSAFPASFLPVPVEFAHFRRMESWSGLIIHVQIEFKLIIYSSFKSPELLYYNF
jgi:hypothetical protein